MELNESEPLEQYSDYLRPERDTLSSEEEVDQCFCLLRDEAITYLLDELPRDRRNYERNVSELLEEFFAVTALAESLRRHNADIPSFERPLRLSCAVTGADEITNRVGMAMDMVPEVDNLEFGDDSSGPRDAEEQAAVDISNYLESQIAPAFMVLLEGLFAIKDVSDRFREQKSLNEVVDLLDKIESTQDFQSTMKKALREIVGSAMLKMNKDLWPVVAETFNRATAGGRS